MNSELGKPMALQIRVRSLRFFSAPSVFSRSFLRTASTLLFARRLRLRRGGQRTGGLPRCSRWRCREINLIKRERGDAKAGR